MVAGRPAPLDRLRSKKKPFTQRVALCCDTELADELDRVRAERDDLRDVIDRYGFLGQTIPEDTRRKLEDLEAQHDALDAQVAESNEVFVFRGLRRDVLDRLLDEHRPTKEQIESNKSKGLPVPDWNPDTFPPALCAACAVSPEHVDLTIDDWKVIWHDAEEWNSAELQSIFAAAYNANSSMRVVDMGKGSAGTRS
jgi:hypothetical protein